jgi:carboxypeptidase family protein
MLATGALLLGATLAAHAQVLRGVVRDSASGQGIPGVVLVLLDEHGGVLGRNITSEDGRYAIALTAAMRQVRLLRIGFRPRDVPLPVAAGGSPELDVPMIAIPTLLSAMTVVDAATCPFREDRAAAFGLWEQAKAALLATVVTREADPARIVRLHYSRRLDDADQIVSQTVRIDSASTGRPWIAPRPAATLVEDGFVVDSARGRWYSGPDADVMSDDAFARGYCFSLARADSARPRAIGVAFARARHRRGHIDIDGTLWIDTVSRTLTNIEFRYVGMDNGAERLRPGGRIDFLTHNGAPMVARWSLRFVATKPVDDGKADRRLEAREAGGEVAHARWRDGRAWQASLGTLRGHIPGAGAAGTVVRLLETDYRAVADSAGDFEISNLLPGPYGVGAISGRLAALGVVMNTFDGFTAARDSVVRLTPTVPPASQYVAGKCESDSPRYGVMIARIVMPGGEAAEDARVEVRAMAGGTAQRIVEGKADANGLFIVCRAPRDTPLEIVAEHDGAASSVVTQELTTEIAAARIQLREPRRP